MIYTSSSTIGNYTSSSTIGNYTVVWRGQQPPPPPPAAGASPPCPRRPAPTAPTLQEALR